MSFENQSKENLRGTVPESISESIPENGDYMIRGTAADEQLRVFAVTSRGVAETARKAHNLSPIATAALGRTMSAALMMAYMLKGDKDLLTIRIDSDGPLRGLLVTADSHGGVKGYVYHPAVILPAKPDGHLNVGGGIGKGTLTVIRDLDLKNTYTGQIELYSGEIAEDITHYFAESEQIPSSVGLGVLMNRENTVRCAGGFIVQVMPDADEEVVSKLEKNLSGIPYVTDMQREGASPEDILARVLDGFDLHINETVPVRFFCGCSREKTERALLLLGETEIGEIAKMKQGTDLRCQFCGKTYHFSPEQLRRLRMEAASGK